jgi:hypothetical protein
MLKSVVSSLSFKTKKGLGCKNAICMQISVRKKIDFFLFEKCHLIFKFRRDYYFIVMKKNKWRIIFLSEVKKGFHRLILFFSLLLDFKSNSILKMMFLSTLHNSKSSVFTLQKIQL